MVRALSRSESSASIVLYCCQVATAVSGALLPAFWAAPTRSDLSLLCLLGMLGAVAQYLSTEALRHAPASLFATFTYCGPDWADRESDVYGQSLSVRVYLGSQRNYKKKTQTNPPIK